MPPLRDLLSLVWGGRWRDAHGWHGLLTSFYDAPTARLTVARMGRSLARRSRLAWSADHALYDNHLYTEAAIHSSMLTCPRSQVIWRLA
jgi:hypothetical protein